MLIFLFSISLVANAQSKIMQLKQKNNFMLQMKRNQNLKGSNEKFGLKVNPYWNAIDVPHFYSSYMPQIKVPSVGAVWARVDYDSLFYDANQFLRTADGGKTWRLDSIDTPAGYGLGSLSAIDANTCYASVYDASDGQGGGIYKTKDGGDTLEKASCE